MTDSYPPGYKEPTEEESEYFAELVQREQDAYLRGRADMKKELSATPKENPGFKPETPEEAARKRAVESGRLIDIGEMFIERLGGTGEDDFLAGVAWAAANPASLVNWRKK